MKIPLEDNYADILSKARRGLGLDIGTLSTRAGLSAALTNQILGGSFDEPGVRALAAALDLHPDRLAAIGTRAQKERGAARPDRFPANHAAYC